jgi:integrase
MPPVSTGSVVVRKRATYTSYALRFRAYGERQFITIGTSADGMTEKLAREELANVLTDVRRGVWKHPDKIAAEQKAAEVPTFHVAATKWFEAKKLEGGRQGNGLTRNGEADLLWRLSVHLLPAFAAKRVDQITVEDVDTFRQSKKKAGLSATSVNKLLATLAAVLDVQVDYGRIERNPAKGKARRLKAGKPKRTYIDSKEGIEALLAAAGEMDRDVGGPPWRRPLVATLMFAGPRISECLGSEDAHGLRWSDVDLAGGRLRLRGTKTEAADRKIRLLPILRDELAAWRAAAKYTKPDDLVFANGNGSRRAGRDVRERFLKLAVPRANAQLADAGAAPLPHLTPHSLRRTYATLLVALREDPATVMHHMGHESPMMTMGLYAKAMLLTDAEREELRAFVEGAPMPSVEAVPVPEKAAG